MRRAARAIPVLLAAIIALSGWKAARASLALVRAPEEALRAGLATPRDAPIRADAGPLAEIERAKRTLVFVYAPDCSVCDANMANWTDLVRETRSLDVRLIAVTPSATPRGRAYWGGLERHVEVITAPPRDIHAALDVGSTPATLLIADGRVRGAILGSLTAAGRAQVLAFAREGVVRDP